MTNTEIIRCLAVDDEPLALQQLAAYIRRVPWLELVAECQSAIETREQLEKEMIDVMFIDINMPDMTGMQLVRSLAAPPLVVFTTAYSEYAVEGYKVDAVDYLLKPFGFDEFRRSAEKVRSRLAANAVAARPTAMPNTEPVASATSDDAYFFKTEHRMVKVSLADIRYVEGMSEYVKIYLDNDKPLTVLLAMKRLEDRLPANFMRIHRSYIVNLDKVQELNKNRVILDAETYLPIGDNYREQFNRYLDDKFLTK